MQLRHLTEKPGRRCRPSWLIGDQETQWRLAAGFVLLSGVPSLMSLNRFGEETSFPRLMADAGANATAGEIRRNVMDQRDSTRTIDRPIGTTIGSHVAPSSQPIAEPAPRLWPGSLLDDMESLIQRYPWPTLLLGLGAGYLLARRMR